ncbi:MAG: TonB-dependent receptor [Moraxellaceae bacterium]|nr:TonB-dependent receptor [Moraxellaceae bacterium]
MPAFRPSPIAYAIFLSVYALPASAMHSLPDVHVSAEVYQSAFSMTPTAAKKQLEKTAGGVGVVDAKDYLTGRAGNMEDTLRLATGVFIASRFGSDEARVSIRGSGLQRTFHGRGLMLLQDGVPINLADGGFDMQTIEPGATRYIEVQRGANALRYGSSTLGGAINYVSHTGHSAPPMMLRAEAGSFGYQRYQAAAAGVSGDFDGYASISHSEQDGFRDHARQRNGRFFGNVGWQLSDRIETRLYATVVDTNSELPGNLSYNDLKNNPRKADAGSVNRDAKRDFPLYRLASRTAIQHEHGGQTEFTAFAARKQLFHPLAFARLEQSNRDIGLGVRHEHPSHVLGVRQDNVIGVQWQRGLTEDEQCSYALGTTGHACAATTKLNKTTAENLTVYGESRWHVQPSTTVSIGGQWTDANRRVTTDQLLPSTGPLYDESYRRFSPKVGVIQRLSEQTEVYANVSGSFEPPSFSEGPVGGQPLDAQKATTYEIGARGDYQIKAANIGYDLSYYRALIKNELLALTPPGGLPATQNADKTLHQGVEAGMSIQSDRVKLLASYLFNDFRFQHSNDPAITSGNDIAGVPRQVLNAELGYRVINTLYAGPTVRAASQTFVDHANTTTAPGYAVYGFKLNQSLSNGMSWFVEARNLTNKSYAATTGVVRDASVPANMLVGRDQALFSPGDGRSLYAGISKAF